MTNSRLVAKPGVQDVFRSESACTTRELGAKNTKKPAFPLRVPKTFYLAVSEGGP